MMPVIWTESAINELARFWPRFTPPEHELIRDALNRIDDLLSRTGETAGESRETRYVRVIFDAPVALKYRLEFIDRQMTVKVV